MYIISYNTRISSNLFVYVCAFTDEEAMKKFNCVKQELTDDVACVVVLDVQKIV